MISQARLQRALLKWLPGFELPSTSASKGLLHQRSSLRIGQAKFSSFRLGVSKPSESGRVKTQEVGFVKFRRNALLSEAGRREFSPEFGKWHVATLPFEPTWRAVGWRVHLVHDSGWGKLKGLWFEVGMPRPGAQFGASKILEKNGGGPREWVWFVPLVLYIVSLGPIEGAARTCKNCVNF